MLKFQNNRRDMFSKFAQKMTLFAPFIRLKKLPKCFGVVQLNNRSYKHSNTFKMCPEVAITVTPRGHFQDPSTTKNTLNGV